MVLHGRQYALLACSNTFTHKGLPLLDDKLLDHA
jgi:hypothetical protein